MPQLQIILVSGTHWDREWYRTFQEFRFRLVDILDELLVVLEREEELVFLLDGNTLTLEDYLEIRPEKRPELEKYIGQGRLRVGPWYCMPDEFLVSGESLIRNLQAGWCGGTAVRGRAGQKRIPVRLLWPHRADAADPCRFRNPAGGGRPRYE